MIGVSSQCLHCHRPAKWLVERGHRDENGHPHIPGRGSQRRVWTSCGFHLTTITGHVTKWGEPPLIAITIPIGDHS